MFTKLETAAADSLWRLDFSTRLDMSEREEVTTGNLCGDVNCMIARALDVVST